jgi:hypothetical protein
MNVIVFASRKGGSGKVRWLPISRRMSISRLSQF